MSAVDTACVSEKVLLDQHLDKLLERNIGYVVVDAGYTDLNRSQYVATQGLLLITPVTGRTSQRARRYVEAVNQSAPLRIYKKKRLTHTYQTLDQMQHPLTTILLNYSNQAIAKITVFSHFLNAAYAI